MSKSVKLSNGDYIDAGAVWDNTQGSDLESLNSQMAKVHTYGPYTYSDAILHEWSVDTEHAITLTKGTYIIRAFAFITDKTGEHSHFKLMPMNEVTPFAASDSGDTPWRRGCYVGFFRATTDTTVTFNAIFQGTSTHPVQYTIAYIKLTN